MSAKATATALVVTPVLNRESLIVETVQSVLGQTAVRSGRVDLRYMVADGGSADLTATLARDAGGAAVEVVSRPDEGMYDALASIWDESSDEFPDVMAYLNAGDLWDPHALDVVLDVMESAGAMWICGYHVVMNGRGQITMVNLPYRFRQRLIGCGTYGSTLPFIQQETTFWSGRLMETVDLDRLRMFRLAGDHYLWSCFAGVSEPTIVEAVLGGYRVHDAPLSAAASAYREEQREVSSRPRLGDRLLAQADRLMWQAPPRIKKGRNRERLLRFDHQRGGWR